MNVSEKAKALEIELVTYRQMANFKSLEFQTMTAMFPADRRTDLQSTMISEILHDLENLTDTINDLTAWYNEAVNQPVELQAVSCF